MKTVRIVLGVAAMMFCVAVLAQTRFAPLPEEPVVEEPAVEDPVVIEEPAPSFSGPTAGAAAKLQENMEKLPDNPGLPKAFARVSIERATQRVERPERQGAGVVGQRTIREKMPTPAQLSVITTAWPG